MTALASRDELLARVGALLARDRWSRERLLEHQRDALAALLHDAAERSPYYSDLLGPPARAETLALEDVPILTKPALMEHWDAVVSDPRLRLAEVEKGCVPDGYRVYSTSGSTGFRGLFVSSERDFATWVAVWLRGLARIGVTPESRIVGIGAPSALHISKQLATAIVGERTGAPELSVVTPLDELVAALNTAGPDTVVTYSSIAGLLADEQLEGRLRIGPERVVVTSEVVTPEVRRRIAAAWGAGPIEVYATTEAPMIASGALEHRGLHVADDYVIVEVADEENRPVPAGEAGARLLLTNLVNRAQPLIRYELSDAVALDPEPDPTGRPYTRIASIDGRSDDVLRMPGRGGREVAVHPYRMHAPFASRPVVRQYQVVHDRGGLHVRVVLRADAPLTTVDDIRAAFLAELESVGAIAPPVEVTAVPSIDREGGDAAKFKLIKAA